MVRTISFGKVDGYHIGKRNCLLTLEIGFREFSGQEPYFTVCGSLWNNIHTDIIRGGQCMDSLLDEYKGLRNNKLYMDILNLWKEYHLKKISDIPADVIEHISYIINHNDGRLRKN